MFLLVPAYPGSPGPKAVKRLCVCVCLATKDQRSLTSRIGIQGGSKKLAVDYKRICQ